MSYASPPFVFQNAAVAVGDGAILTLGGGVPGVLIQVKGITSATLIVQLTIDGVNWVTVDVTTLSALTSAASITADGLYAVPTGGAIQMKVRISVWASGTIQVTGSFSTLSVVPPLPGGSSGGGTIGTVNQGTAAGLGSAWPVSVTDGTNLLPTGDAAGRSIFVQLGAAIPAGAAYIGNVGQHGTFTVATNADATVGPGAAPVDCHVIGGQYLSSLPTLTTGQTAALQVDSNGRVIVTVDNSSIAVSGTVAATQSGGWTMATNADGTVTPGTAPAKALVIAGVYNTSPPTPSSGQVVGLQVDANGQLLCNVNQIVTVTVTGTTNVTLDTESTLSPGTAPAKCLITGARYVFGGITLTNGQTAALQADSAGNLLVNVATSGALVVSGTVTANQGGSWTVATNADCPVSPGAAPSKALLNAGQYLTSAPTLSNAQVASLQVDTNANLKVVVQGSLPSGTNVLGAVNQNGTWTVASNADAALTAGTAPAKALVIAGQYNSSLPAPSTGQTVAFQLDASGRVLIGAIPTGANTIGAVTQASGPWTINATQIGGTNVVSGVAGTFGVGGDTASGSNDAGYPVKAGAVAHTTYPANVTDGQRVNAIADKTGALITRCAIRDLKGVQNTTITSSTAETTIVTAPGANIFADLYGLILANTSASATQVTIKDSTGGTTRAVFEVPAGDTRGFMLPADSGIPQSGANANWTATSASSIVSLFVTALYVLNK
jgi:hypothetical protein